MLFGFLACLGPSVTGFFLGLLNLLDFLLHRTDITLPLSDGHTDHRGPLIHSHAGFKLLPDIFPKVIKMLLDGVLFPMNTGIKLADLQHIVGAVSYVFSKTADPIKKLHN